MGATIDWFQSEIIGNLSKLYDEAVGVAKTSVKAALELEESSNAKDQLKAGFVQDILDTRKEFWDRKKLGPSDPVHVAHRQSRVETVEFGKAEEIPDGFFRRDRGSDFYRQIWTLSFWTSRYSSLL